jgi:hypothetical protein
MKMNKEEAEDFVDKELIVVLEKIAKNQLRIDTLKTRNSDRLDFYNCSVAGIKDALKEAYVSGMIFAMNSTVDTLKRCAK